MKLRILRDASVVSLRKNIGENLDQYRTGEFGYLSLDSTQFHELPVVSNDGGLALVKNSVGENHFEVDNCLAVHSYLAGLSPYDARDERLWCHLTHTIFLDYTRQRWPIPSDDNKAIAHISTHFFASSNRQVERDNAVSRLWWMAHLCTRVNGATQKEALEAFLFRSDVRANIIERPTVAQSTNVFSLILRALISSAAGKKALFERTAFRRVMVELNSVGGFKLLDALPEQELDLIFADVVHKRANIPAL